ncbi:hypothetical protein LI095_10355, partial [Veillonella atypica]|uniref:hypothetical protein n=1 Tax=Veillonella atypica TaxID=39777 RepID=UPI001D070089
TYKNGKPEFIVINGSRLSRFDILAMASNSDDKEFAWELIKIASQLFHWQGDATFNSLYDSVVTKLVVDHENNEFKLHQKFNEQVK